MLTKPELTAMIQPQPQLSDQEFNALIQELDRLVTEADTLPFPRVREQVFEMLQCVDLIHREGLSRLLAFLQREGHDELVARAADDAVVRTLFLLYGMVEGGPEMEDGEQDSGDGRSFIGLNEVRVAPSGGAGLRGPEFVALASVEEVAPGSMVGAASGSTRVLLVNVGGDIFAVGDLCPGSQLSLSSGALEGTTLRCPWHGEVFDVRSGRCLDPVGRDDDPRLPVYPLRIDGDQIEIGTMRGNDKP